MWEFIRTREKCGEVWAERESFSHFLKFFISLTDAQQHGIYLLNLCEFVVHESSLYTELTYMQLWKVRYVSWHQIIDIILFHPFVICTVLFFKDCFRCSAELSSLIFSVHVIKVTKLSPRALKQCMDQNWQAIPQWVSPATI